ncbi:MAG: hypothetical protein ABW023_16740 [Sphingomonas sp.]
MPGLGLSILTIALRRPGQIAQPPTSSMTADRTTTTVDSTLRTTDRS